MTSPGGPAWRAEYLLQLKSAFKMPAAGRGSTARGAAPQANRERDHARQPRPPGAYELTRQKDRQPLGGMGLSQRSAIAGRSRSSRARRRPRPSWPRPAAPSLSGRPWEDFDRDTLPGRLHPSVRHADATGDPFDTKNLMKQPTYDFTATAAVLRMHFLPNACRLPGVDTVVAEVYAPPASATLASGTGINAPRPRRLPRPGSSIPAEGKPEAVVVAARARWRWGRSRLRNWKPGQIRIQTRGRDRGIFPEPSALDRHGSHRNRPPRGRGGRWPGRRRRNRGDVERIAIVAFSTSGPRRS